ncbi:uncharacterized protein [Argopecten irradians]|uniref:uncharacterized protein n=1 Tax=Argopecten irradians TaxID=31199 RepID=UPI003722E7A1
MATNIPDEAISIHNDMVDELSVSMTDKEFKKLKRLLEDVPLTASDKRKIKSVQKLFSCLIDKTFIFYGDYEKLKPKLTLVKPSLCTIVQRHAEAIEKILRPEPGLERFAHEDITIMMYDTVYKTWEGSQAAFVDCKVDPLPDRIVWKRDKTIPLRKKVLSDNHKYYYSPQTPTLVIRDPKKSMDEAQYQCWAEAKGANADGDIVQLQVAVPETIKSIATTSIPGPSEDFSSTTINIPPESSEGMSYFLKMLHRGRKVFFSMKTKTDELVFFNYKTYVHYAITTIDMFELLINLKRPVFKKTSTVNPSKHA